MVGECAVCRAVRFDIIIAFSHSATYGRRYTQVQSDSMTSVYLTSRNVLELVSGKNRTTADWFR